MAQPLSADRLVGALKAEGVTVREKSGWRTHNRNSKGPWSNLNGVVIHHTAGRDSLALCWSGTSDLPGPLCHTHLAKDGVATMVGYGRANHAGTFAQNAHNAVVDESSTHPRPDASEPVDGNAHYYGIEIENLGDGRDPYPSVQYQAAVRWAAAICRAHGWSAQSVIGHKEGTRRKIDPSFDMDTFRDAVAARLAHDPGWNPGQAEQEDSVALSDDDVKKLWYADLIPAVPPPYNNADWTDGNEEWTAKYALHAAVSAAREAQARTRVIEKDVAEIKDAVSSLSVGGVDLDLLAVKVADLLAQRLSA